MLQLLSLYSKLQYKSVFKGMKGESLHTGALEIFSNGVRKIIFSKYF